MSPEPSVGSVGGDDKTIWTGLVVSAVRLSREEARLALADFQMALKWGGGDVDLHYAMGVAR